MIYREAVEESFMPIKITMLVTVQVSVYPHCFSSLFFHLSCILLLGYKLVKSGVETRTLTVTLH